jgi:two-component system, LytTR family, response regulator LytT
MKQQFVHSFLSEKMQRAQGQMQDALPVTGYRTHFLIKQGQRYKTVAVDEIAYFFVDGRLTYMMTWNKAKLVVNHTLEEVESMIAPTIYYRANRAFIIHKKAVHSFKSASNGKLQIELHPVTLKEVMVSKEKATEFKCWMSERI